MLPRKQKRMLLGAPLVQDFKAVSLSFRTQIQSGLVATGVGERHHGQLCSAENE